ncbi:hypothetical protein [Halomarina pelagica]|uniref:hypothetical protein n=1 Tax=Halomarina pelagica TaxID=2961599 RepID=UPI0020C3975E|nr:hypothetical protein [Halomarina sp. BND7]
MTDEDTDAEAETEDRPDVDSGGVENEAIIKGFYDDDGAEATDGHDGAGDDGSGDDGGESDGGESDGGESDGGESDGG